MNPATNHNPVVPFPAGSLGARAPHPAILAAPLVEAFDPMGTLVLFTRLYASAVGTIEQLQAQLDSEREDHADLYERIESNLMAESDASDGLFTQADDALEEINEKLVAAEMARVEAEQRAERAEEQLGESQMKNEVLAEESRNAIASAEGEVTALAAYVSEQALKWEDVEDKTKALADDLGRLQTVLVDFLGVKDADNVRTALQMMRDGVNKAATVAPVSLAEERASGLQVYKSTCRRCQAPFTSERSGLKLCPTCPPLNSLKGSAKSAPLPASKPKPKELGRGSHEARKVIACQTCHHAKRNSESETGWECVALRFRDCSPWTVANCFVPREVK